MKAGRFLAGALCLLSAGMGGGLIAGEAPSISVSNTSLMLVVGAPGDAEYGEEFARQADAWKTACRRAGHTITVIGESAAATSDLSATQPEGMRTGMSALRTGSTNDLLAVKQALESEPKSGPGQFWLVFVGHGTYDGKEARFNLRGPDLAASELADWLRPFQRPIAVLNTSPSSAPFLNKLSATNRLIITATRSGHEQYHTRFGQYFAEAITDPSADLDKDEEVSLLEAFLMAARRAGEFYKLNGRIATEHALLDDNGDGLGTPADWFQGLRATKKPKDKTALDGMFARQFHLLSNDSERDLSPEQRARRDELVRAVLEYRELKASTPETEYYSHLEKLLLELARFYDAAGGGK